MRYSSTLALKRVTDTFGDLGRHGSCTADLTTVINASETLYNLVLLAPHHPKQMLDISTLMQVVHDLRDIYETPEETK